MGFMIAKERLYLTADRSKVVPQGHKEAKTLYASVGDQIPEEAAERFGLSEGVISADAQKALEADAAAQAEAERKAADDAAAAQAKAEADKKAADDAAAKEAAAAADKEQKNAQDKAK